MQSIDRTFKIIEIYLENNHELSISEIAEITGLSPSVVHRIVTSLVKKGYLTQKEKKGKYSLGLKFLNFAYMIRRDIKIDMIMPFLNGLNKEADEAVMLGNIDKDQLLVIERIDSNHALRISGPVGRRSSLHCTAIGKLFMAHMSEAEKRLIYKKYKFEKFTENTITDIKKLESEFEIYKTEGCIYDREENAVGIWSVASPVYDFTGKIEAGLAVLAPTVRITPEKIRKLSTLVKLYSSKISRAFGYIDKHE